MVVKPWRRSANGTKRIPFPPNYRLGRSLRGLNSLLPFLSSFADPLTFDRIVLSVPEKSTDQLWMQLALTHDASLSICVGNLAGIACSATQTLVPYRSMHGSTSMRSLHWWLTRHPSKFDSRWTLLGIGSGVCSWPGKVLSIIWQLQLQSLKQRVSSHSQ